MRKLTLLLAVLLTGFLSVFAHAKTDLKLPVIDENLAGATRETAPDGTTAGNPFCNDPEGRCPMPFDSTLLTENRAIDVRKVSQAVRGQNGNHNGGGTENQKTGE